MNDSPYTLDDLAAARAEAQRWDDAFANARGNNPSKFEAQRRDTHAKVRRITEHLKCNGLLEMSDAEKLTVELDRLYPDAKSGRVVDHQGLKYRIRYFPLVTSRSAKSVKEWGHEWVKA